MITESQISANRKSAGNLARSDLGLPNTPGTWTYEQRIAYNKALAAYILRYPNAFAASDIATAQAIQSTSYSLLDDGDFSVGEFTSEFLGNAVAPFQAIGQGVINAANLSKALIPIALVAAVVILLVSLNKKANA